MTIIKKLKAHKAEKNEERFYNYIEPFYNISNKPTLRIKAGTQLYSYVKNDLAIPPVGKWRIVTPFGYLILSLH